MTTIDLADDLTDMATLWFDGEVPARMLWRGERWHVTDRPTEPEGLYWTTHAPAFSAWRFQATDERGVSRVFDLVRGSDGAGRRWRGAGDAGDPRDAVGTQHWIVAHVYD